MCANMRGRTAHFANENHFFDKACLSRRPSCGLHSNPYQGRQGRQWQLASGRGKGFGSKTQEGKSNGFSQTNRSVDEPASEGKHDSSRKSRGRTLEPNDLLKKFFESWDKAAVAEAHADDLSENFFIVLDSFMGLANNEGNVEVISTLKQTLEAAMKVKQRSLRPEIQLLNQLLADKAFADRAVRLSSQDALNTLQMNDGYFFELLRMMTKDAEAAPKNEYSTATLQKLTAIQKECTARAESIRQ